VGDPNLVGTLAPALAQVGVACLLLGSAVGSDEQLAALHSTRLQMLLERMLDTTVRGVVYEAAGTVDPALLSAGADRVRHACERSLTPYVVLTTDPSDGERWVSEAVAAVERALLIRDQFTR
jgi:hypothetical protein